LTGFVRRGGGIRLDRLEGRVIALPAKGPARGAVIEMVSSRGTGPARIDVSLTCRSRGRTPSSSGQAPSRVKPVQLTVDAKTMDALNKRLLDVLRLRRFRPCRFG
jgi:hypothetical protein